MTAQLLAPVSAAHSLSSLYATEVDQPFTDRRHRPRLRTVYRLAHVRARGDEGLARVQNLSNIGMMLVVAFPLRPGDPVHVTLSETIAVEGEVVWTDGERCGLRLRQPIDSADVLRQLCAESRSGATRPLRLPIGCPATVLSEHGTRAVTIIDISQRGMKLAHDGGFNPGLGVKVTTDAGIERRGRVRWSRDGLAGVIITEPFTVAELGALSSWRNPRAASGILPAADPSS